MQNYSTVQLMFILSAKKHRIYMYDKPKYNFNQYIRVTNYHITY